MESAFTAKKEDLRFAINAQACDEYGQIAQQITMGECKKVGLSFIRNNLEYQLLDLLVAPQIGSRNPLPGFAVNI